MEWCLFLSRCQRLRVRLRQPLAHSRTTARPQSGLYSSAPALAAQQPLAFAGVLNARALLPAPAFGGFFVLAAAPELPDEAGFLHLPFEQPQGKLHIVVLHHDGQSGMIVF